METIEAAQDEIVEEFSMFEDWMQRYEYMIELGKSLPLIDPQFKIDDFIIKGCLEITPLFLELYQMNLWSNFCWQEKYFSLD